MTLNNPKVGAHYSGEYQSSGLPWTTTRVYGSTPTLVDLPKVTRAFVVRNLDGTNPLRVGFTEAGLLGENFFEVPANSSERFEIRTRRLFLSAPTADVTGSLMAELTLIPANQFPILSGSSSISGGGADWEGVG